MPRSSTAKETVSEAVESTEKKAQAKTSKADNEFEASKAAALESLEKLLEARQHFKNAATAAGVDIKHDALEQLLAGKSKADEFGQELSEFARAKPGTTLALAFLGGFVLAQLLSRK
jgi:cystathionine beta-lyase family protein involved in aluminum resistance